MNIFYLILFLCSTNIYGRGITYPSSVVMFDKKSSKNPTEIFDIPVKKHVLFFTDEEEEHHELTLRMFGAMAKEYQGELLFIRMTFSELDDDVRRLNIERSALPALFVINIMGMKKTEYEGDVLDEEATRRFINAFANDDLDGSEL